MPMELLIGKMNYLLPVYGGAPRKYLKKLQCILNNSARFITGAGRREKSEKLMQDVNWLNVDEMIKMHTLTFTWKLFHLGVPQYLADNIYRGLDNNIYTTIPRLQHSQNSLKWRMCSTWNSIASGHQKFE